MSTMSTKVLGRLVWNDEDVECSGRLFRGCGQAVKWSWAVNRHCFGGEYVVYGQRKRTSRWCLTKHQAHLECVYGKPGTQ